MVVVMVMGPHYSWQNTLAMRKFVENSLNGGWECGVLEHCHAEVLSEEFQWFLFAYVFARMSYQNIDKRWMFWCEIEKLFDAS